jgi:hypothetical protein
MKMCLYRKGFIYMIWLLYHVISYFLYIIFVYHIFYIIIFYVLYYYYLFILGETDWKIIAIDVNDPLAEELKGKYSIL